jgi:motility quorum-sensing regulator/GCU-specific mRNA interferase toxin
MKNSLCFFIDCVKIKGMEKRRPHYKLQEIKAVVAREGMDVFTFSARQGAAAMGLTDEEVLVVIGSLGSGCFHKSMTTHADPAQWQDVYHAPCPGSKTAYVKFTLRKRTVVISFKEKTA